MDVDIFLYYLFISLTLLFDKTTGHDLFMICMLLSAKISAFSREGLYLPKVIVLINSYL